MGLNPTYPLIPTIFLSIIQSYGLAVHTSETLILNEFRPERNQESLLIVRQTGKPIGTEVETT